eukprot:GHVS01026604.1.p1 GENE.GHVS01026604.1~~GHVS01026604.1.p1  ORF type:complete len:255 (+),score=50.03 GHVS01026604.1:260-1024(+)
MDRRGAHELLVQLNDRLYQCEQATGLYAKKASAHALEQVKSTEEEEDVGQPSPADLASSIGLQYAEQLETAAHGAEHLTAGGSIAVAGNFIGSSRLTEEATLSSQVAQLASQASGLIRGPILEYENNYTNISNYLEAEHAEISSLFLNMQAKRSFILQHQGFLRNTAEQLKQFDQLRHFVNPQDLSEMENYQKRLQKLDEEGGMISEKSLKLGRDMQDLAQVYNSTMNMVSGLFMQWDAILKEREKSQEKRRKT